MLGSHLIPTRWRRNFDIADPETPRSYSNAITPYLQTVSLKACTHPLRTIVFVAFMASAFYVHLLETGFFQPSPPTSNKVDLSAFSTGSRRLRLGPETAWKWQVEENGARRARNPRGHDVALVTLDFLDSANSPPNAAPQLPLTEGTSAQLIPSSENILSPISSDTTMAFSLPQRDTVKFLEGAKEIPGARVASNVTEQEDDGSDDEKEQKLWLMRTAKKSASSSGLFEWARDSWTAFLDLIKNAETLDIVIVTLGYLSMYLTFASLFLSMRRMGSNFWLATTTLFSSAFAFLFGLLVTLKLGVPENVVLLSEGVPFLVVTVGFEKPIMLTQAVLSASMQGRSTETTSPGGDPPLTIQNAIQVAVRDKGFEIVRDYVIEIIILCAGAASGIQGGLKQFCFLAAWTLFFDCILLFTFYTSILTIKLEINRIKRHVNLRKALEEDGVSRRVAENVAAASDWSNESNFTEDSGHIIFGKKTRDSSVPRFKLLMVSGFILINVVNLCTMPFRGHRNNSPVTTAGLSSVVTQPPMDPFKVAGNGLDFLYGQATKDKQPLSVTVFAPIKYEYQYPSIHYSAKEEPSDWNFSDMQQNSFAKFFGGKMVESLLKSFEDPILSKWVIIALALSLVLNGYLFNAARWSIKEPQTGHEDHEESDVKVDIISPMSPVKSPKSPKANGRPVLQIPHTDSQKPKNGYPATPLTRHEPPLVDSPESSDDEDEAEPPATNLRTKEECEAILAAKKAPELNDTELVSLALRGKIPGYSLEKTLENKTRAVKIRRAVISRSPGMTELTGKLEKSKLPYKHFDYDRVFGACCENVVGYMPLPLGVAGPMTIDGRSYYLPMATTEGVLVASTSRGAKAINAGGGCVTVLTGDGMTRGPCIGFDTLARAAAAKVWLDGLEGQKVMRDAFNSTSRFARLQQLKTSIAGTYVYVRFKTTTGDAMGMNMISKGVEHALSVMSESGFSDMAIISVSGNFCTDKKPAAINWIDGRGKSVVAEAIIPGDVVRKVLKSDVDALVELNVSKNFIGSAMAGSIGGFNAHAANIVTAIFLATGQDPAQNVESSNCITVMKNLDGALQISVSMPSIEVGTIGGGTVLEPQAAMLDLLGVRGAHPTTPGANAQQLARFVAAGVLAGELSLCSALAAGHLVKAHMSHNRSQAPSAAPTRPSSPGPQAPATTAGVAEKAAERAGGR